MKKILLPLFVSVISISLSAQIQSGYVPFHQYIINNHGDIQKHDGNSRNVIFEKIAYMHYVPSNGSWTYADSGQFYFGQYIQNLTPVYETGGTYFQFVNDIKWDTSAQFTTNVNGLGLPVNITGQNYSESSHSFTNTYRYGYGYNSISYLGMDTLQTWNGSAWVDSIGYSYTYAYSANNYDSTVIVLGGSALQNDTQYLYTYTGWNNTELITQVWNGSSWVNLFKAYNSFDANNNNYQSFVSMWNGSGWVNYALIIRGYDLNNNLVSYISELWNSNNGVYLNNYQEAYAYVLGDITQFENFNWDTTQNAWVPYLLNTYNYDTYHNVIYEFDQTYSGGAFQNTSQYYYYYVQFDISGIKDVASILDISIYPNPSSGNAAINFTAENTGEVLLNIYDIQGNLLQQQKNNISAGNNLIPFNLSGYAAGNYYLQVVDGASGKSGVLKFVKE